MTATHTTMVTVDDFITPTVNSPSDIAYMEGDTGNNFTWNPVDDFPVGYILWLNDAVNRSGAWNSTGESISVDADGLPVEYHNFTIVFTDRGGNSVTDSVFVRVNSATYPTLDHPADLYIPEGATGNTIIWSPYDQNRDSYKIYRDGVVVKSKPWRTPNQNLWISVDGLALGDYNYTCEIMDQDNNYAYDTVWVYVYDGTAPLVNDVGDITYPEGDSGTYSVAWSGTDTHPSKYEIFLDDNVVKSGDWNSSSELIEYDAGGLSYGEHILTIELTDVGNNEVSDSLVVTVFDGTPPEISDQQDVQLDEGAGGTTLIWNGIDLHPSSYTIYFNDSIIMSGDWNSTDEFIAVEVIGLSLGAYNYTAVLTDEGSNNAVNQAIVTVVDNTPPGIDSPSDLIYLQGTSGHVMNWTGTDLHPSVYEVYVDGKLRESDTWSSSPQTFTISVDGLGDGAHQIMISSLMSVQTL